MHAKQSHCLISAVFVSDTGQQTIIKTWQHDNLHDQSICRWIWVSMTMLKIQTVIGNWSIILCQLLTGIIQYNHTKKEVGYFLEKWKIISCKFDVDCLNVVWSTIMVWHGLTLEQGKCSHWQLCAGHCSHRMWHAMDLSQFGRKSFISQRALEEVLTVCKSNLDELATTGTSRTSIKRSRDTAFDTNTPYGKLMQRFTLVGENGEAVSVDFISPQAMLWHACSECPKFARAVQQMLVKERPTIQKPLTVCLYADEISPGNNLKRDNRRRVQAIYWSIRQLGPMQLSMESSWFFFTDSFRDGEQGEERHVSNCKGMFEDFLQTRPGLQAGGPAAVSWCSLHVFACFGWTHCGGRICPQTVLREQGGGGQTPLYVLSELCAETVLTGEHRGIGSSWLLRVWAAEAAHWPLNLQLCQPFER